MVYLILGIHVLACLILVGVVLLQTGKRADLAGAFGGGGSQTAFGARGAATFLSKMTTTFAVVFMLTSIGLSIISSPSATQSPSVLSGIDTTTESEPADTEIPALPAESSEPAGSPLGTDDPADPDQP